MKTILIWVIFPLIAIQFITIDVPDKLNSNPKDELKAPTEVMSILKRSCFDCHSNSVTYPWYDKIAPASWYVKMHVKKGREIVNFSKWNSYSKEKRLKILDRLPKAIVIRMPLPTYLWLHKDAKLSNSDKEILRKWIERLKNSYSQATL